MRVLALAALFACVAAFSADGATQTLTPRVVVRGLASPTHVTAPRSEPGRLYVVEQPGRIRVVMNGKLRARPFLDITRLVKSGGEQGLLSVAFHPGYAKNRRFYVDYTDLHGDTRIVEYRSDKAGTRALPATRRQLFSVRQPYANHNGGQLAFGPDGMLYVGMGDGGSGGDPENRAQNLSSLLGKLLRIDAVKRGARPVIAAYGLRNPWRFSFDRATGDLWIGDVGQDKWEEIDWTPRSSPGLENYGWDVYEGDSTYEQKQPAPGGHLVAPVYVYSHDEGYSVTGGFVYRGTRNPSLRGRYVFGDYGSGEVSSLRLVGGKASGASIEARIPSLSSFGEDAKGELYAVSLTGTLYRLT